MLSLQDKNIYYFCNSAEHNLTASQIVTYEISLVFDHLTSKSVLRHSIGIEQRILIDLFEPLL
jgi:hypothetical protein